VPTQALISISHYLTHQYMYYGPVALIVITALVIWSRRPSGSKVVDWLKLHTPVLRTMFNQLYITRIARTMATLLGAGVNLLDIIDICRGVTDNYYYARMWNQMERDVRAGKQISDTVFESKIIPANVASMISAGERAGRLSQVMEKVSEFSEQELETAVKQATAYIEPIMILMMGLIVGGIAMALLLPIFSMGKVLSGSH
jgi:type IV pilus assembly protein PilC